MVVPVPDKVMMQPAQRPPFRSLGAAGREQCGYQRLAAEMRRRG